MKLQRKIKLHDISQSNFFMAFQYLLAFLLLINSSSIYSTEYDSIMPIILKSLMYLVLFCFSTYSIYKLATNGILHYSSFYLFLFLVLYLLIIVIDNTLRNYIPKQFFLQFFITILSIFYFYYLKLFDPKAHILNILQNEITILAYISLAIWILGPCLNFISPNGTTIINWGGIREIPTFFDIYGESQQMNIFGLTFFRNTSIFAESPMYAFVISISLSIRIFIRKIPFHRNIVLLIILLSTGSFTGIIICFFMIMSSFYLKIKGKLSLLIVGAIGSMTFLAFIFRMIMLKRTINGDSLNIRINDYYAGFISWLQHPILGNGINNYSSITKYMDPSRVLYNGNNGFSNGLMEIMAYGGIYLLLFYILPLLLLCLFKRNRIYNIGLSIIMFTLFATTIISFDELFLIMIIYIIVEIIFDYNNINIKVRLI